MSYVIEEVNGCTKKIVFNFETLDLTGEIEKALKAKQKEASFKGFRKGKAPLSMVEQIYGPQVETEALNNFVRNEFFQTVEKEDLKVVGQPEFENMKYEQGKSVSFDAKIELFPEFSIGDIAHLSFEKDKFEVTDKDIEEVVKQHLSGKAEMTVVEDKDTALDKGHFSVINFQGEKEDGERPENMKGEEFLLEIGSGQFIPGFEDAIIGMKSGEKKDVPLSFPEDYHAEDLKNAKVKFEVELLEIKEKKLPELTEELAKEFGFDSVEDMKSKTQSNLSTQKEKAAAEKLHQEILEKLVEITPFDVPATMVAQQRQYLQEDLKGNLQRQGFNDEMAKEYFEKWADDLDQKAQFQVRSGLILESLAKEFNVEVSDADLDNKLAEMAEGTGMDLEQIKGFYADDSKAKTNLRYAVREEKTFANISEKVTIK